MGTLTNVLRGRYRPLAPMGVIEAPRVQLTNGLFRTIEKPTSVPTAASDIVTLRDAKSFMQGGRPKAGAELTRNWSFMDGGRPEHRCGTNEKQTLIGERRILSYPRKRLSWRHDAAAQERNSMGVMASWIPAFAGMERDRGAHADRRTPFYPAGSAVGRRQLAKLE